jgi:two-component system CitB family response regulator
LSASEVAAHLGTSRATAQRYLARLEAAGRITMTLRYGSAGRPEHRYRYQRSDFPGANGVHFPS